MTVLALDIGRTTCRAGIFSASGRGPTVQLAGGATLADHGGSALMTTLVESCLRRLGDLASGEPSSVVVAAAGALSRPAAAGAVADSIAAALPAAEEIVVTGDVVAAHAGGLSGDPGVVLVAGTGAVALAIAAAGTFMLIDGHGFLVGDAGSGFAVGRSGLAAALRHRDGRRGGSAALASKAVQLFGPLDQLPGVLHADPAPARTVASFAPAVAAAARDGDETARAIWAAAVAELADTITAACRSLPGDGQRVAVAGGMFDLPDLVTEPLRVLVAARIPRVDLTVARSDPLAGAASLGHGPAGIYEQLLLRRPRDGARLAARLSHNEGGMTQ